MDFIYADNRALNLIEQEFSTRRQGNSAVLENFDDVGKNLRLITNKTIMCYENKVADTISAIYRAHVQSIFIWQRLCLPVYYMSSIGIQVGNKSTTLRYPICFAYIVFSECSGLVSRN